MAAALPVPPPPVVHRDTITWEGCQLPGIDVPLRRVAGPVRPGVPVKDPHYVFREPLVREVAWAAWPHDGGQPTPCLLVGGKGCGKTSLVQQIAAFCNIPVFRINLNVGTTVRHLKGRIGAEDGATTFVPGVVTMAMEMGAWLILDELSGATPPVALALFPVLEPQGEVILEDAQPPRYVKRHPDFRVFATDNTIGAMQEEHRFSYGGTNPMVNEALLDRFGSTIQVDYMSEGQEHEAIKGIVPGIQDNDLEGLIRVVRAVRGSTDIQTAFSMRMLIDWARRVAAGRAYADGTTKPFGGMDKDIVECANPAFLDKIRSKVERDAIIEVMRRIFAVEGTKKS
jgi:MoxR-like ATPase